MSQTISEVKDNLSAMLHGGTLSRVRNIEALFQRATNTLLAKIDPIDTVRTAALTNTVHDDVFNYTLPSDYKSIIDLFPQDNRQSFDDANNKLANRFDLRKGFKDKTVSIEASEGDKILRINWRSRQGKVLSDLNDVDDNGTWIADATINTTTGIVQDKITKISGSGSVRFDIAATGDGIQNTTLTAVDFTDEDEVADIFFYFFVKNSADLALITNVIFAWGIDLTTNFWTGVAQTTQADGSAFKVGWNRVRVPWSTATETGTVTPANIDSASVTFTTTGAISDLRVDNIIFSIGRNFDIKYYSKFLIKNTSGTFITKTTSDDDVVILDDDAINIFLYECLVLGAHQMEGVDSVFDINFARQELDTLYARYKVEYQSQTKKPTTSYGSFPRTRGIIRGGRNR